MPVAGIFCIVLLLGFIGLLMLDEFERPIRFHRFRIDWIKSGKLDLVVGKDFFLPVRGQQLNAGTEFRIVRDDASTVVIKLIPWPFWLGKNPPFVWTVTAILPPQRE